MIITDKQIDALRPYMPNINDFVLADDLYEFELALDELIVKVGFGKDDELNETGLLLQRLYDEIYLQND